MTKALQILFLAAVVGLLAGFGFYGPTPVQAYTPTGQLLIAANSSTSTSGVLATSGASVTTATTAIIANMGSYPVYVLFGASNVVAASSTGYAVPASSVSIPISIRSAGYAAAISTGGSTTVSISTGY
jgi:hypothetical protein